MVWTLVIIAALDVYGGASINIQYVDGFANYEFCATAAQTLNEGRKSNDQPRIQMKAYCVRKQ